MAEDSFRAARLYSRPLEPLVASNHLVVTDGSFFAKAPDIDSPSPSAVSFEALVIPTLGVYDSELLWLGDSRPLLVSPSQGTPLLPAITRERRVRLGGGPPPRLGVGVLPRLRRRNT